MTRAAPGIRRQKSRRDHKLFELALQDSELSSTAKCVLGALLFGFKNSKTDQCNPGFDSIAKAVGGKTRRATINAVQELRRLDWLLKPAEKNLGGSKRNTNEYAFSFHRIPVKNASPHTGEQKITGEENDARGEENFTRTTEEPLAEGQGGSSNHRRRAARSPYGSRGGAWKRQETATDVVKDLYGVGGLP
jgi:hypothetical protein